MLGSKIDIFYIIIWKSEIFLSYFKSYNACFLKSFFFSKNSKFKILFLFFGTNVENLFSFYICFSIFEILNN